MDRHTRERRWLVLAEDGRHVWLGRHRDPTDTETASAEASLTAQSLSGWLAVSEGDYWSLGTPMTLIAVRPLGGPGTSFERAVTAFESRRRAQVGQT